ncbi:hypothetical protein AVEN_198350-1 [Araneus ventricosus]|uniref:Uncharacterized protein n=1 Tax=Araneus ventricosus TaxID=182803 RepID=A0A4Y2TE48_ARAVE|nr:hypothetical protein AVEN_198350-1 [Araneus ventricosus]
MLTVLQTPGILTPSIDGLLPFITELSSTDSTIGNIPKQVAFVLTSVFPLIHDYSRPHSAVVIQNLLEQFKWDVSDHLTYSPDLAPSDFHLFSELKNWQGGQNFQSNEELQSKVKAHLTPLVVMFFKEGIEKLLH